MIGRRSDGPEVDPEETRPSTGALRVLKWPRNHAGGGTRTPDTRIMIPLHFGSAAGFEGAGGPKRGHDCAARAVPFSERSSASAAPQRVRRASDGRAARGTTRRGSRRSATRVEALPNYG